MSARPLRQPTQVHIRCADSQLLAWRAAAALAGLDLSAWIRWRLDREAMRAAKLPSDPRPAGA